MSSGANSPVATIRSTSTTQILPAVAAAEGGVGDLAQYVGTDGKVLTRHGAPGLAFSASRDQRFNPLTLVSGSWPEGADEVAVDGTAARRLGAGIGDAVRILPRGRQVQRFRVSGIIRFGSSTLGGATLAVFDLPTAQRLFDKQGKLDQIDVTVRRGYSVTTLQAAWAAISGRGRESVRMTVPDRL